MSLQTLDGGLDILKAHGTHVEVVHPDDAMEKALAAAGSILNPAVREPAARAGRAQGVRLGGELGEFWL